MGGADRLLVCLVILSYGFSSRTHVAQDFAAKAAKGTQVVSSQTPFVGSQHLEEVPFSQTPSGVSSRISSAFSDGLAMPVQSQGQSQWSDTPVVQCLRSTLQGRCLVAGNFRTEEVAKQKEEIQSQDGTQGQNCGSRIARALRETGRGRSDESDSNAMGANNASSEGPSYGASGSQLYTCSGGEFADVGKATASQTGCGGERSRRCNYDGNNWGFGGSSQEPIGAAIEANPQGCHSTAEGREQLGDTAGTSGKARYSMARMGQVHQGEVRGAVAALSYQEGNLGGKVQRTEREGVHTQGQDEEGSCRSRGQSRSRTKPTRGGDHGVHRRGKGRSHRTGRHRRRADGGGASTRREEDRRRQPQELAFEGTTQHVRFSPELAVSIFDEDCAPDSATFSFKLWEGELENWDSKPWALYGGPYVEAAGSAFSSSTLDTDDTLRGVGMSSASDRRTQLDHNLFHQLRDEQGVGLLPAVLEGQLPREDLLQVRLCTFGCLQSYLGRRNRIAERVDEAPLAAFLIDEIYDMWKDITPVRLRMQIVHPQPEDFTVIPTIYVVVDFGETGVDQPVLIDRRSYSDHASSRHLSVAYLPPRATWHSIVRGCELQHQCRSRVRNQCIMKIGQRLVLDGAIQEITRNKVIMISYEGDELTPEPLSLLQVGAFPKVRTFMDADEPEQRSGPSSSSGVNNFRRSAYNVFGEAPSRQGAQDDAPAVDDAAYGDCDHAEQDLRVHLFHTQRDYVFIKVTPGDPFLQRNEIATAWNIPTDEVVGFHPVDHPPSDLTRDADQTLIIRWQDDEQLRPFPTDVLALFDVFIHGRYLDTIPVHRRAVYWSRSATTREGLLHFLRAQEVCRHVLANRCIVSHNNQIWPSQDLNERRVSTGDYFRVDIPPEDAGTRFQVYIRLWDAESGLRTRRVYESSTYSGEGGTPSDYLDFSDRDSSGSSSSSNPSSPQDDIGPHQISLLTALHPEAYYQPSGGHDAKVDHFTMDFQPMISLLQWMDSCIPMPAWELPQDFRWDEASVDWVSLPWWDLESPDELHFYTDGSAQKDAGGAGCVLFVRSGHQWFFGGYLAQTTPHKCSHVAELVAILQAYHWSATILHWLTVLQVPVPSIFFHYDSTSAGHKALGRWGGKKEPTITRNLRAICRCIEFRFGVQIHGIHVYGHTGDAGNEAANTVARYATSTTSSGAVSAWAIYFAETEDPAVEWLWALWKPEWKGRWDGPKVSLSPPDDLRPDPSVLTSLLASPEVSTDIDSAATVLNIDVTVAVANVLTLCPYKEKRTGLTSHARTDMLMQQFHDATVHFVGVLETRMQRQAGKTTDLYHVIH